MEPAIWYEFMYIIFVSSFLFSPQPHLDHCFHYLSFCFARHQQSYNQTKWVREMWELALAQRSGLSTKFVSLIKLDLFKIHAKSIPFSVVAHLFYLSCPIWTVPINARPCVVLRLDTVLQRTFYQQSTHLMGIMVVQIHLARDHLCCVQKRKREESRTTFGRHRNPRNFYSKSKAKLFLNKIRFYLSHWHFRRSFIVG